jgi:hypothetical protein
MVKILIQMIMGLSAIVVGSQLVIAAPKEITSPSVDCTALSNSWTPRVLLLSATIKKIHGEFVNPAESGVQVRYLAILSLLLVQDPLGFRTLSFSSSHRGPPATLWPPSRRYRPPRNA